SGPPAADARPSRAGPATATAAYAGAPRSRRGRGEARGERRRLVAQLGDRERLPQLAAPQPPDRVERLGRAPVSAEDGALAPGVDAEPERVRPGQAGLAQVAVE